MKININLIIAFKLLDTKTPRTQIHTNKIRLYQEKMLLIIHHKHRSGQFS